MYSDILGNYLIMPDTEQNGRPVYKHLTAGKFILYNSGKNIYNKK